MPKLLLEERQRQKLKEPLGQLVTGTIRECNQTLKKVLADEKPRMLILVGDTISRSAAEAGILADVVIADHKEMRGDAVQFSHGKTRVFRTTNAPGTIDLLAWQAIAEAVQKEDSAVLVDGEEDLLTLVAIIVAPEGSLVAYGQPERGIVLVRISASKKGEIEKLIYDMPRVE